MHSIKGHIFANKKRERECREIKHIVGCRGAVQLEGPDPWYILVVPAMVGAHKSFLFTESSLEILKN